MSRVFISYSRQDIEFVRQLHRAFERDGRKAWVDWEDIPRSEKWKNEGSSSFLTLGDEGRREPFVFTNMLTNPCPGHLKVLAAAEIR